MRDILDKGEQLSWGVVRHHRAAISCCPHGVAGENHSAANSNQQIATIKFNPLTRAHVCGILILMNPINDIQSPNADALAARTPFVSIVVPVYNVAPYLRECLDSVLAQTFTDWECLCVNDGSTDGSGAILDEYAQKDSRFRVFHQANAGVSAARNLGLDNAKGEWVLFLDSDDLFANTCLDSISKHLTDEIDWLSFNAQTMDAKGTIIADCRPRKVWKLSREDFSNYTIDLNVVWGNCFRRSWLDGCKLRFDVDLSVAEDSLFMSMGLIHAQKVKHLGDVIGYFYRLPEGRGSLMVRAAEKYWNCRLLCLRKLIELGQINDLIWHFVCGQWIYMIYLHALSLPCSLHQQFQKLCEIGTSVDFNLKNVKLDLNKKIALFYWTLPQCKYGNFVLWLLLRGLILLRLRLKYIVNSITKRRVV